MSAEKTSKAVLVKHVTILCAYLLIVWGFYRFLFKLPDELEELVIKPLLWLIPVYILTKKEGLGLKSLGITSKNYISSVYLALGLGAFFALEGVLINYVKYEGFNFSANVGENALFLALGISAVTAVTEELTFRGYVFGRLNYAISNTWMAIIISSVVWGAIHVPLSIFWLELTATGVLGFFLLTTIFGIGATLIYSKTKNILAPILLHILWIWPIVLFR